MENIVRGVLAEMTDEYTFLDYGRIEALVYICLCEKYGESSSFERNRFGVSSEEIDAVLSSLCDSGTVVEDVRPTFGGDARYYYRVASESVCDDEIVRSVCAEYGEIPVSNLHSMAGDHSW